MPAFYASTLAEHATLPNSEIVGQITLKYSDYYQNQKRDLTRSWNSTVAIIKAFHNSESTYISDLDDWTILYEYPIPRRSKRIDAILLCPHAIYVLEFKIGATEYLRADARQLLDYCLDLRDFHLQSKERHIIPVLVGTSAPPSSSFVESGDNEFVSYVQFCNEKTLGSKIREIYSTLNPTSTSIDVDAWNKSAYMPTPTIIEAARTIYSEKTTSGINRNQAGIDNLQRTQDAVLGAINYARENSSKAICFITGVPGAGKTLAGLNIVHGKHFQEGEHELGIFLSGNSPLVKVLSEALAIDFSKREGVDRQEARRKVGTFITNVHSFIDAHYGEDELLTKLPPERLLIYDEAQRAWTAQHKARKSNGAIKESEPEVLLSIMSRLSGWGVIVCLVGGGQEINTGEAGLREWGRALESSFQRWKVYISPNLIEGDHSTGHSTLFDDTPNEIDVTSDARLHLDVTIRSPRAKAVSEWVASLLDLDCANAIQLFREKLTRYPIYLTRDLEIARQWLREKGDDARTGLIASSGGRRLRAIGPDPYYGLRGDSKQDTLGAWYLNKIDDVRSSNFLEVVATEYAIQGLEIDYAGLLWDADLRFIDDDWEYRSFVGTNWQNVNDEQKKRYILNKYRVLLTRARDGMIIFIPHGNPEDATRLPEFYDGTYNYLSSLGIPELRLHTLF